MERSREIEEIVLNALRQMDPEQVVLKMLRFDRERDELEAGGRRYPLRGRSVYVMGTGKASVPMARAVEQVLGSRLAEGLVITPKGTAETLQRCRVLEGNHPWPGEQSVAATDELLAWLPTIPKESLVLSLISGGSSALLSKPAAGISQQELEQTYRLLLDSGADIHQMNVVRTALSQIKGGQLLRHLSHVTLIDLILSDVPGDELRSIGSGPTTPGLVSRRQALRIVQEAGILSALPASVRSLIKREEEFVVQPHPGEHRQLLAASARMLAEQVAVGCREKGIEAHVVAPAYNAPIGDVEQQMASRIRELIGEQRSRKAGADGQGDPSVATRQAVIWYGESSVQVTGEGKGGRNQELALRIALQLKPDDPVVFLSLGTDGVDGPTDAAGAVVDAHTITAARDRGLDPEDFLARNDSWQFFEQAGGLLRTGPTGNNLMDLQVALIG